MKFEASTLKDIAKALGISTSTVSRALRDSYEISKETKKMVLDYAAKINYHPNPIALSLKEQRSQTLGVLISEVSNSFFSQIIDGIESVAHSKGYNVIIAQSHESYKMEVIGLNFLASRSVDGVLLSVSNETSNFTHIQQLYTRGLPFVFFDRIYQEIPGFKVVVNNQKGAEDAIRYLSSRGCKRIAHIANAPFLSITSEREKGYEEALRMEGLPFNKDLIRFCIHGGQDYEETAAVLEELLALPEPPDGIFTSGDRMTRSAVLYFKRKNIRIPEDIKLIGFSNSDYYELLSPPLPIIQQPAFEIGKTSAELLIRQIESKRPITDFETKILETKLVV